jgi:hypothetical protein
VIQWHDENPNDWLKTWHLLQAKWSEVEHCPDGYKQPFNIDAKLNGGYVVIGLLCGNGDWYKTMNYATRCGQGAECNPANAAGILGTLIGARDFRGISRAAAQYLLQQIADGPSRFVRNRCALCRYCGDRSESSFRECGRGQLLQRQTHSADSLLGAGCSRNARTNALKEECWTTRIDGQFLFIWPGLGHPDCDPRGHF